jgi:hypothetical protein
MRPVAYYTRYRYRHESKVDRSLVLPALKALGHPVGKAQHTRAEVLTEIADHWEKSVLLCRQVDDACLLLPNY